MTYFVKCVPNLTLVNLRSCSTAQLGCSTAPGLVVDGYEKTINYINEDVDQIETQVLERRSKITRDISRR